MTSVSDTQFNYVFPLEKRNSVRKKNVGKKV